MINISEKVANKNLFYESFLEKVHDLSDFRRRRKKPFRRKKFFIQKDFFFGRPWTSAGNIVLLKGFCKNPMGKSHNFPGALRAPGNLPQKGFSFKRFFRFTPVGVKTLFVQKVFSFKRFFSEWESSG